VDAGGRDKNGQERSGQFAYMTRKHVDAWVQDPKSTSEICTDTAGKWDGMMCTIYLA